MEHLHWLSQDSEDRLNPTEMIKSYLNDYAILCRKDYAGRTHRKSKKWQQSKRQLGIELKITYKDESGKVAQKTRRGRTQIQGLHSG